MEITKKKTRPSHKSIMLIGKVLEREGRLGIKFNSEAWYQHFLKTQCHIGDDISIRIESRRPKRSESQNAFYHVFLHLLVLSSGHSKEELEWWVKQEILKKGVTEVFGTKVRRVNSTTDLNMSEFCEMMNEISEKSGVPIPDPAPFNLPLSWDEYGKLKEKQEEDYSKIKSKLKIKKKK